MCEPEPSTCEEGEASMCQQATSLMSPHLVSPLSPHLFFRHLMYSARPSYSMPYHRINYMPQDLHYSIPYLSPRLQHPLLQHALRGHWPLGL